MHRAPLAIFCFKRLDTLKATLASLEKCRNFREYRIFIFSDQARPDVPGESAKVENVRAFLRSWSCGKACELIFQDFNLGLRKSISLGVTKLVQEHGDVIVLEDDIVVSPVFLDYMQTGLDKFRNNDAVWQISAYFTPTRKKRLDPGFLRVPSCWGWATWSRAWKHYSDNLEELLDSIPEDRISDFNINSSYDYLGALQRNKNGTQNTWHVRWYAAMFRAHALALYPGLSLTKNIGFSPEGTNCQPSATDLVFHKQSVSRILPRLDIIPDGTKVSESEKLLNEMAGFFKWQTSQWTKPTWKQRIFAKLVWITRSTKDS